MTIDTLELQQEEQKTVKDITGNDFVRFRRNMDLMKQMAEKRDRHHQQNRLLFPDRFEFI